MNCGEAERLASNISSRVLMAESAPPSVYEVHDGQRNS